MYRVTLLRSHLSLNHWFFQTLFVANLSLVACPAWSAPVEGISRSAIDLVEQRPPLKNGFVAEEMKAVGRGQEAEGRGQEAEGRRQEAEGRRQEAERTNRELGVKKQEPGQEPSMASSNQEALQRDAQDFKLKRTPDSVLDLDPRLIESSPVLQRWLKQVPDVLADIKRDPSFRTRLRVGYVQFPSSKNASGLNVGIEDIFVGRSGLTLSADYQTAFNGQRTAWGGDLRYYIRPLGSVINVAPVLGYRHLETTRYNTEGIHVGVRLLLVPSRTGAADLALTQSWVAPRSENEVGLTTLSLGYALTHNLRLSTDLQKQNSRVRSDSRVGINLEWMF
ncbi:MAG: hypothetical protein KME27_23780 [Lyngbya sp. HA4199-MV5]|nr:hypothetical protein [Lyngbya sp. HA4199-MV5]